jgi:hypothetical protein
MLNAWIDKNDILNLLSKSETINDCVERAKFLFEIHRLKEHRKPKKPQKQRTVNYSEDNNKLIQNYRRAVKYKRKTSYLESFLDSLGDGKREDVIWELKNYYREWFLRGVSFEKLQELEKKDINIENLYTDIIPSGNLKDILKISAKTISRWEKRGYISPIDILGSRECSFQFYIYDLSKIKL